MLSAIQSCLIITFLVVIINACQPKTMPPVRATFESNRFVLEDLATNLNEPMELSFLPDGRILFIERRGILKMYDPISDIVQVVGEIPVYYITENGLLGLAIDPDYSNNSWIYLFYTDPIRKNYQNISRFDFKQDSLWRQSEKLLLEVYLEPEHCCHSGGCLDFGPEGLLYITTGDNVGGTDFAPIDERPGHHLQDAQRSAANTMDLRGKILRIRPEDNGTYSIPEGNLFPVGTGNTRPEIYVMGVRNPLKMNVDPKTGWLIWGEVGPNPGIGDPNRGPRAHEEINLAKSAGNFGWPYIIADNKPYADYNYGTDEIGAFFNPDNLINDSPNNTGIRKLPPAQKALIWYPNVSSDSFPLTSQGGSTVGSGPFYHYDENLDSPDKLPRYFDNKLFIYEWMRSWILAVYLDQEGKYVSMEEFLPDHHFKKPIDIRMGPDGAMYVLDYGSNWYAHNPDARLTRVSYTYGNRPPIAHIKSNLTVGRDPLTVQFSAGQSVDYDKGDQLSYHWNFDTEEATSTETNPRFTFEKPGSYQVQLTVTDASGSASTTEQIIQVGNDPPDIDIQISGNQSFIPAGNMVAYQVKIDDHEDGNSADGRIDANKVNISLNSLPDLNPVSLIQHTAQADLAFIRGKELIRGSDCFACHAMEDQSVGPDFQTISQRYKNDQNANGNLSQKILSGGKGVWGDQLMPAHPQHTPHEIQSMVSYILSLGQEPDHGATLPLTGTISTPLSDHLYVVTASYKDQGSGSSAPIERQARKILRKPVIPAVAYDYAYRVAPKPYNEAGDLYAEIALNGSYVGYSQVDLNGVQGVKVKLRSNANYIKIEMRLDTPDGKLLSSAHKDLAYIEDKWAPFAPDAWFDLELPIPATQSMNDIYFVCYSDKETSNAIYYDICQLHSLTFELTNSSISLNTHQNE